MFLLSAGIAASALIVVFVLAMVRERRLTEEYATLWLAASGALLLGSIFSGNIFRVYARLKGATGSGPGFLLFLVVMFLVLLLILLTSKLSVHQQQIKKLTQRLALLEADRERPQAR